jgi:hypothetical protein
MGKILKWILIALLIIVIGIQFIRPERTNPPVDQSKTIFATLDVPPNVRAILERSCFDCHSNNTQWPWYSHVAPTSWLVASDVKQGRGHVNFSTWADYDETRQISKLDMISQMVTDDKMPLKTYRLMHPKSVLTKAEVDLLSNWAQKAEDSFLGPEPSDSSGKK